MKNEANNTITLRITHDQDFIHGTRHSAFLVANEEDVAHAQTIPLVINATDEDLLDMMDSLRGIKFRISELGKEVKVVDQVFNDPNFETKEEADKYLQEM